MMITRELSTPPNKGEKSRDDLVSNLAVQRFSGSLPHGTSIEVLSKTFVHRKSADESILVICNYLLGEHLAVNKIRKEALA